MGATGTAIGYAVLIWWSSTAAILFLNHLPTRSFRYSIFVASIVAVAAAIVFAMSARLPTTLGTYGGFTCAVVLWGWHEMSFFMGVVTGPRRIAGPPSHGWRRFRQASETCLYHQAAIAATGLLVLLLSHGQRNLVGCETFLALWAMRLSATFNVFLGVRNLNLQFLPRHLAYLAPYMTCRRMNWLLPFSMIGGVAACVIVFRAGDVLLAALLALGVVEHICMVLPVPFAKLWQWSIAAARQYRIRRLASGVVERRPSGNLQGNVRQAGLVRSAAATQRR